MAIKIQMSFLEWVAYILVAVGAINWGLVGLLNFNLVEKILTMVGAENILKWVYGAVGLAGAFSVYRIFK
jgi:hypothetical protein